MISKKRLNEISKMVKSMKNAKAIIFFVSLFGAIAGALFTRAANPPEGFLNLIVLFALIGVIFANLILLMIYEISKSLKPR